MSKRINKKQKTKGDNKERKVKRVKIRLGGGECKNANVSHDLGDILLLPIITNSNINSNSNSNCNTNTNQENKLGIGLTFKSNSFTNTSILVNNMIN